MLRNMPKLVNVYKLSTNMTYTSKLDKSFLFQKYYTQHFKFNIIDRLLENFNVFLFYNTEYQVNTVI